MSRTALNLKFRPFQFPNACKGVVWTPKRESSGTKNGHLYATGIDCHILLQIKAI